MEAPMAGLKMTCFDCGQVNRVPDDKLTAGPKCATCGTKLMSNKAIEIDLKTLQKAAKTDDVPLVVDFWAPWCGPCRMMAPEFSKAASELSGKARLVKVNTEMHQTASPKFGIRGIPTMVKFAKGKEVKRQSGAVPASAIVTWAST